MKCDCLNEIGDELKKQNLRLVGLAFTSSLGTVPYIQTGWIELEKAPKGKKKNPPYMFASHCPFCGQEIQSAK